MQDDDLTGPLNRQKLSSDLLAENTELRAQIAELQAANQRKDEFLGMLAHELRNPLAPISNSLQILAFSKNLSPETISVRSIMQRQINQLVRLIDDLADVGRIARNKVELRKELVSLEKIVQLAVETSRPLLDASQHQLSVSILTEPLIVDADTTRLAQVFAHILSNAAKYSDPKSSISLTVRCIESWAEVSIQDSGSGIPIEMLSQIFELFMQVDPPRRCAQGGLGIGLTLAKHWVEMHGGQINARSAGLGHGTELVVRLPLAQDSPQSLAPTPSKPVSQPQAAARRILVVDDTRSAAYVLSKLLQALGQKVETADCAEAALANVRRERPDIVISDISMPDIDGYELARRLRQEPGLEGVVLVALTGHNQDEDRQKSKAAGFDHHLVKPVSLEALQALLK